VLRERLLPLDQPDFDALREVADDALAPTA
jgi:hypothetical protein